MLFFGSISGSGGGSNYWQLNGATPNTISTTPSVTGIDAPLQSDSNLRLVNTFLPAFGVNVCGAIWQDASETFLNGIDNGGGGINVGLHYLNFTNGTAVDISINNSKFIIRKEDAINNISNETKIFTNGTDRKVSDGNTLNDTTETQDITKFQKVITTGGVITNEWQFDAGYFRLSSGLEYFVVNVNGELHTNQIGVGVFVPTNDSTLVVHDVNGHTYKIQATLIP